MEDKFLKFSRLYLYIFLAILAAVFSIAILIGLFYGFSSVIASHPVDVAFEVLVLSIPTIVFSTAYIIFLKRTKNHPSKTVQYISYIFFIAALACCIIALWLSIKNYFTTKTSSIGNYATFSLLFLAGNVGLLFFIAILQALTTKKEVDWREKRK